MAMRPSCPVAGRIAMRPDVATSSAGTLRPWQSYWTRRLTRRFVPADKVCQFVMLSVVETSCRKSTFQPLRTLDSLVRGCVKKRKTLKIKILGRPKQMAWSIKMSCRALSGLKIFDLNFENLNYCFLTQPRSRE